MQVLADSGSRRRKLRSLGLAAITPARVPVAGLAEAALEAAAVLPALAEEIQALAEPALALAAAVPVVTARPHHHLRAAATPAAEALMAAEQARASNDQF